ncbi:serine hydroxymethyltransferase [Candidatus Micrarchaeota archaeon]|nr:serine hydroxymethyltransferase [Candidatus Micrarchaeota archaeon]
MLNEIMDSEINKLIDLEEKRQKNTIGLIASENIVSPQVREATGSVLTHKYAEGYPGKRYYGGNQIIDEIETMAIERVCKLFGTKFANVQPHAGSQANMAVYFALMEYGDKFLGLDLSHGGHLTHGSPVNFSGKIYRPIHYQVNKEGWLDYNEIEKIAKKEKPKLIQCGYTACPRTIDFKRFKEIADSVDAYLMADVAHTAGLIAGKAFPSPVGYADAITFTTHKTLRGPRGAVMLWDNEELEKKMRMAVFPGLQGGPMENVIAAKAVCFYEAMQPEFKEYAKQVVKNARTLAEELMSLGFKLITEGTDSHLILIDLHNKEITGKEAQNWLETAGIVCNKNTVPYDDKSPFVTSGIRFGTPIVTTRGMKESEMKMIADWVNKIIESKGENSEKIKKEVEEFAGKWPLFA